MTQKSKLCSVFMIKMLSQRTIKSYNKTCMTSKDSYQPVHPSSTARVLVYLSLDSLDAIEGTCDQRRL